MVAKIVIDTNVFISALIGSRGASRKLIRRCLQGEYIPLMGNPLFCEYESVIGRDDVMARCPLNDAEVKELFAALMHVSQWVSIYYLWRPNLKDEGDNHVIELAIAGNASIIATKNLSDFEGAELMFPQLSILKPEAIVGM